VKVAIGARSDVGRVRETNQDSYLVSEPLFGVADGMGGHLAGDVASATAVETVEQMAGDRAPEQAEDLARFLKEANRTVWDKAQTDDNLHGMGTTFTLLHLTGATGRLAHVGDSRAYLLRDDRLQQLSEDHTLVERMVQEGRIRREDAAHHPQRSVITRALGVDQNLNVDLSTLDLQAGDRLLLCSDGLSSMVSDDDIARLLSSDGDMQSIADSLVEAANEAGGEDNITVVILELHNGGNPQPVGVAARPESEPEPAPERVPTKPREPDETPRDRRWPRVLLVSAIVLIVLGIAAYGTVNYALDNSWFVGTNDGGVVTIYRGIPDEALGLSLREVEEETSLNVDDLPDTFRENLANGIKVDSLEEARETVADLEDRSRDFGTNRKRTRSN
jgi:protein phosphatase